MSKFLIARYIKEWNPQTFTFEQSDTLSKVSIQYTKTIHISDAFDGYENILEFGFANNRAVMIHGLSTYYMDEYLAHMRQYDKSPLPNTMRKDLTEVLRILNLEILL